MQSPIPAVGLYLTNDLMFLSRVGGEAQQQGWRLESSPTIGQLVGRIQKLQADGIVPRLLIIDLALPNLVMSDLVEQLSACGAAFPWIAYGPHVQHEQLQAASQAGCVAVLSRSEFNASYATILRKYLGTP